ncbi:hypothetical protein [Aeromonas salmonicida]|uniref:hypothetical protein n=1 Tax=Aeromonas salmonicida TaxID=645 RepID=UPI0038BDBB58
MANEYYERLSEMNPGELADGLAIEAELDAIAQAFGKLPTPHTGGQGFDGPVRVGDAVNNDEAVSFKQLKAAVGEAVLLDIAIYGDLNATAWSALPSNNYVLYGTGAQFSNTPYTLVAGATYYLQVRHVIGGAGVSIYHDQLCLASTNDPNNVDLRRLFVRTGSSLNSGWFGFSLKKAALTALESLAPAADQVAYYTGAGAAAMASLTAFARSILDDVNAAAVLSTLDISDVYKKRNIIGLVGQSGGIPTGAIIERGSNANGEYTKYADGTMECYATYTDSSHTTIAYGSVHSKLMSNITMPVTFSGTNIQTPAPLWKVGDTTARRWCGNAVTGAASNSWNFEAFSATALSGVVASFQLRAIGRWF